MTLGDIDPNECRQFREAAKIYLEEAIEIRNEDLLIGVDGVPIQSQMNKHLHG
jgi:hypothetical protein